jgi:DNA-binding PadR family transcriptional regulator
MMHHFHRRGLRHLILYLLSSEGTLTGAEIMEKIEANTIGMWRPSPGSVYPMIKALEDEGLIKVVKTEGTKKYYGITEKGREVIGEVPLENKISNSIRELDSLVDYLLDNWDNMSPEDKVNIKNIYEKLRKAIEN